MTALITSSTSGSEVSASRALTQSSGRLKVGMPMAMSARPGASIGAYQPPRSRVTAVSVVMSNQIQPPSSKGCRPTSNSTTVGVSLFSTDPKGLPSTAIRAPVALER